MKTIQFTKSGFPRGENGTSDLPFSRVSLLHAVVVAGAHSNAPRRTRAAKADIAMRQNALVSSLVFSGNRLRPTPEYRNNGSTAKAMKSFFIGNALCAHSASEHLRIPWLVDVERLTPRTTLTVSRGGRRPDFIGRNAFDRWFVFESKGRSTRPFAKTLREWKRQAGSIKKVNGKDVERGIVSAAYLNRKGEWELLWADPPSEPDSAVVEFSDDVFFGAYYDPLLSYMQDQELRTVTTAIGLQDVSISLSFNPMIRDACEQRRWDIVIEFAFLYALAGISYRELSPGQYEFSDGLIVRTLR
jgi:hypothetical protein